MLQGFSFWAEVFFFSLTQANGRHAGLYVRIFAIAFVFVFVFFFCLPVFTFCLLEFGSGF